MDLAITENNIQKSMALIVLDFSQLRILFSSLEKWLKGLKDSVSKLKVSKETMKTCKERVVKMFCDYHNLNSNGSNDNSNPATQNSNNLEEGVLTENIGIPIVVICNKAETETLAETNGLNEIDYDYICCKLREVCLKYGAGLIFTSSLHGTNIDVLYNYITCCLLGHPYDAQSELSDKSRLFVPIGWDEKAKVEFFLEMSKISSFESRFAPIINQTKKRTEDALDDQEFLKRLLEASRMQDTSVAGSMKMLVEKESLEEKKDPIQTIKLSDDLKKLASLSSLKSSPRPSTPLSSEIPPPNLDATSSLNSTTAFFQSLESGSINSEKTKQSIVRKAKSTLSTVGNALDSAPTLSRATSSMASTLTPASSLASAHPLSATSAPPQEPPKEKTITTTSEPDADGVVIVTTITTTVNADGKPITKKTIRKLIKKKKQ
eukprot:TRINITY_DN14599_c0_g1_i1.p1 TRINITY_DN14599_c0_g1~~TRINITY_DN14599_c0_g1_i1.p1  ORF type:complete len:502 (-),score=168.82 TRINITY_DN14599_c0_g1_i1:82-1383(-)